jgi:hypothetical protein
MQSKTPRTGPRNENGNMLGTRTRADPRTAPSRLGLVAEQAGARSLREERFSSYTSIPGAVRYKQRYQPSPKDACNTVIYYAVSASSRSGQLELGDITAFGVSSMTVGVSAASVCSINAVVAKLVLEQPCHQGIGIEAHGTDCADRRDNSQRDDEFIPLSHALSQPKSGVGIMVGEVLMPVVELIFFRREMRLAASQRLGTGKLQLVQSCRPSDI